MSEMTLAGSPYERGRQQGECGPAARHRARAWLGGRLARARPALRRGKIRHFLVALWDFAAAHYPRAIAETRGIADGFGLPAEDVFAGMHAAVLREAAARPGLVEGCTAIAIGGRGAPLLAKTRDVPAEVLPLQRVFRLDDPSWRCGPVLGVSSLGSSPCSSSGINRAGLAVADTQVATSDHGIGLLRYFLMESLLGDCATVGEALARIAAVRHLGGGTLVMADAGGAIATVELGHQRVAVERRNAGHLLRTNHFISGALRAANGEPAASDGGRNSRSRLRRARLVLAADAPDAVRIRTLLSGHGGPGPAFCRHEGAGGAATVSLALYAPKERTLAFANGPPCATPLVHHRVAVP